MDIYTVIFDYNNLKYIHLLEYLVDQQILSFLSHF